MVPLQVFSLTNFIFVNPMLMKTSNQFRQALMDKEWRVVFSKQKRSGEISNGIPSPFKAWWGWIDIRWGAFHAFFCWAGELCLPKERLASGFAAAELSVYRWWIDGGVRCRWVLCCWSILDKVSWAEEYGSLLHCVHLNHCWHCYDSLLES